MLFAVALGVVAGAFTLPAGLAADSDDDRLANDMPVPLDDPAAVANGKDKFAERCSFCHGGGGRGAKGPCLICGHFKHGGKSSQLYANIAAGIPGTQMGAFGTSMQREEILNILAFLRDSTRKRAAEEAEGK